MPETIRPHPEYFARQRLLVAERRRFSVSLQTPPGWDEGPNGPPFSPWMEGRPSPILDRALFEALLPTVRRASSCEIRGALTFTPPYVESAEEAGARVDWIARYILKNKRALFVDVDAEGVFDDLPFWHWLLRVDAEVIWYIDRAQFEESPLWRHSWNPGEGNHTVGTSTAKRARDATADGDSIAVTCKIDTFGVQPCLIANPRVMGELFESAIENCHWQPDYCQAVAPQIFVHDKFRGLEASISVMHSRDAEGELERLMKRGINRPADDRSLEQGLTAAELTAAACGRRSTRVGRFHESEAEALDVVRAQGTLNDATLDLAYRFASDPRVQRAQVERWAAEESKAECRGLLDDLVRRLEACRVERRVRGSAPNATPMPPTAPASGLWPEAHRQVTFYATGGDLQLFLDMIAGATGATYHWLDRDGGVGLCSAGSPWELGQALEERLAGGVTFGDLPMLYIAWPTVADPAIVHEVAKREVRDSETGLTVEKELLRVRAGWGVARLAMGGPKRGSADRLLWSTFEYPTGTEVRGARYQRPGPWTEVDWKALRAAIRQTRAALRDLATGFVEAREPVLVLPDAAAAVAGGASLGGKAGWERQTFVPGKPGK